MGYERVRARLDTEVAGAGGEARVRASREPSFSQEQVANGKSLDGPAYPSGTHARSWANSQVRSTPTQIRTARPLSGKALVRSIMAAHLVAETQRRRGAGASSHAIAIVTCRARRQP